MNLMYVPLRKYGLTYGLKQSYQRFFKALGIVLVGVAPNVSLDCSDLYDSALGLFLPGGDDICPARYGGTLEAIYDLEVDAAEEKLYKEARRRGQKVLGICRGLQAVNVFEGGTLRNVEGHMETSHDILYMGDEHEVNSYHRQAVETLSPTLQALARAKDGTVEILESLDQKVLAFQFHVEKTRRDERRYWLEEIKSFLYSER